jgi:hypothetical protein
MQLLFYINVKKCRLKANAAFKRHTPLTPAGSFYLSIFLSCIVFALCVSPPGRIGQLPAQSPPTDLILMSAIHASGSLAIRLSSDA